MIFDDDKSSFDLGEEFLAHYGVKGMHWGIRNEDEPVGRDSASKKITSEDVRSAQLEAKYGKDSMDGDKGLSDKQKKALLIGGGLVAGAAALGVGYLGFKKYTDYTADLEWAQHLADLRTEYWVQKAYDAPKTLPGIENVAAFRKEYPNLELSPDQAFDLATGVNDLLNSADAGPKEGFGLFTHWDKGVELASGTVVQRLSTKKEKTIRPDGFFAAFDPPDVKRYMAELPTWWERWGYKDKDGYLTQLKSKKAIKAPSGKQSVQILADMLSSDISAFSSIIPQVVLDLPAGPTRDKAIFGFCLNDFQGFSGAWTTKGAQLMPNVARYFDMVQGAGYDALIDFNDSGTIAKTPMRFLDGNLFDIIGNIPVSEEDIATARQTLEDLVMSAFAFGDKFLAHYGKKGMHWGIRKALPKGGSQFWVNTGQTIKGKNYSRGIMGKYGRKAGLGLKAHPAFAIAGGALIAAMVAGSLFARHQRKKVNTIPAGRTTQRGNLFVQTRLTINNQDVPLGSIQNYQRWPHTQLQSLEA